MKKKLYITFLSVFAVLLVFAQGSIIEDLNQSKKGEGNVKIFQDDSITKIISAQSSSQTTDASSSSTTGSTTTSSTVKQTSSRGYKIQVYSGNDQKKAKTEANHRKNLVESRFPQLNVKLSYSAPVWTVWAGGFATRAEADKALHELRAAFPSFGREMYVIR